MTTERAFEARGTSHLAQPGNSLPPSPAAPLCERQRRENAALRPVWPCAATHPERCQSLNVTASRRGACGERCMPPSLQVGFMPLSHRGRDLDARGCPEPRHPPLFGLREAARSSLRRSPMSFGSSTWETTRRWPLSKLCAHEEAKRRCGAPSGCFLGRAVRARCACEHPTRACNTTSLLHAVDHPVDDS